MLGSDYIISGSLLIFIFLINRIESTILSYY